MIIIGSDHTGIEFKFKIINYLKQNNIEYMDATNYENQDGDDYPDIAYAICSNVLKDSNNLGIAICGTGIGISIACNKICGIRAALCTDIYTAEMSKRHNNANVLCLGAKTSVAKDFNTVEKMIELFIKTQFEGGRHERRIDKIKELEISQKGGQKYDNNI